MKPSRRSSVAGPIAQGISLTKGMPSAKSFVKDLAPGAA